MGEEEKLEQQEEKIVMGGKADQIVNCQRCGKEIKVQDGHSFETEDGKEVYVCNDCIAQINQALEEETKNPNIFGAILLGLIAGIVCGLVWYFVVTMSNTEYAILTILMGWFVGSAVCKGAGNKKGMRLQIIAALLTAITLVLSELFIGLNFIASDPEVNMTISQLFLGSIFTGDIFNLLWEVIKNAGPIGLLIWGFGLFWAYSIPRPTKI